MRLKFCIYLFLLLFIKSFVSAQTISNPGRADSLYPVVNFYNSDGSPNPNIPTTYTTSIFSMAKSNSKYYLLGNFKNVSENSGSTVILDTAVNSIVNNRKWRINGVVKTAIPDGQGGFYIGGTFTKIGDSSRKFIAQITNTGKPTAWKPVSDNIVNILIKRNDTLFIGGAFKNFANKSRSCFAMYSTTGDSLCTNGGIQAFTFMQTINAMLLQNDTLIYGGTATNVGDKNIRKYNFKNHVNLGWGLTYADYADVNFLQLSPDKKVLIYAGYSNGEYIKGASNTTGTQQFFINVSMFWPSGYNTGSVNGLKVYGSRAYAVGNFEHLINNYGIFSRKGIVAFNPNTGELHTDIINLNGYSNFLETRSGKLLVGGKFTTVNGNNRNQFAVVDTGTLAVDNWQLSPSDGITSLAFTGPYVFLGGQFKSINAVPRNGFAAIDSATHTLLAWNPINMGIMQGKRMVTRGDSLFILGYTANSGCYPSANTKFKIYSLSTGSEYSINQAPDIRMNDFIIDGDYMYVAYDRKIRRYSLPSLVWDQSWGYNWAGAINDHSLIHLVSDSTKIYAIGDTRYTSCASQSYAYRGYFDVYSKTNGGLLNSWYYEGANNQYDIIYFTKSILSNDRLYIAGSFSQLNGNLRRNFVCLNATTGAITNWQTNIATSAQTSFTTTSDFYLYKGKLWLGSSRQLMNNGNMFNGFGAIDTATGAVTAQPVATRDAPTLYSYEYGSAVNDFIINDGELTVAGIFDTVSTQPIRNFAKFTLTGTNRSNLCAGGSLSLNADISGTVYQWQMNSGSGFASISDNTNFSGTQNAILQLISIPSAWYGYQFRCLVNGAYGDIYKLEFTNNWTGNSSTAWENPANWSCGTIPDVNTDVVISSGTLIISNSTSIRSLSMAPGVNLTVSVPAVLTVIH